MVVFYHEHRLAAAAHAVRSGYGAAVPRGELTRKIDTKSGAHAHFTSHAQAAARLAYCAVTGAESEPGASPQLLRGKERLEDAIEDLRSDACAVVGDKNHDVLASWDRAPVL